MPYYKVENFVQDYHSNTVNTIHDIKQLEDKLRKIIFNMFDSQNNSRIDLSSYSDKKNRYEDVELSDDKESNSVYTRLMSKFRSTKREEPNIKIDLDELRKEFVKHFYNPLHAKST